MTYFNVKKFAVTVLTAILVTVFFQAHGYTQEQSYASEKVTSMRCDTFTFDGTGSYDPDSSKIDFLWDFGDGHSSTEPIIEHTYLEAGEYQAVLTVTDNTGSECSTSSRRQMVRVNIPPKAEFLAPAEACANEPVNFDGSRSSDDVSKDLNFIWNFGDGSTQKGKAKDRVSNTYQSGGDYKVSLTVNDGSDTVCSSNKVEKIIHVNEPPRAEAGEDTLLKCVSSEDDMIVSFDASATMDVNNDSLHYTWYFGDGTMESGVKVNHRYAELGQYDAKLLVKDSSQLSCGTNVDFVRVRLSEAPKADAGEDAFVCSGDEIVFDGTKSYATTKGTLSAQWHFGDGSNANGLTAKHRYRQPGKYVATLAVKSELNAMCPESKDTKTVIVNSPPVVEMTSVEKTCVGKLIEFEAGAHDPDNDALEYYWSFGDGTILRSGSKVSHAYKEGGKFRVTVIVDDSQGTACSTATATTTVVVNAPPIADAGTNLTCCVEKSTQFDASNSTDSDGDPLTYSWDFGDGTKASGKVVNHAYKTGGSYNVRLVVDDNSGTACNSDSAGFVADVNAGPVPVMDIR